MKARFECPACETTAVIRDQFVEGPIPKCVSCDESQSGRTEMVWVGDVQ